MNNKVAMVLAGGGVTGVAFTLGVLRAINEAWLNRTVNDIDTFVGTSAGSYVAAYLASGVSLGQLYTFLKKEISFLGSSGPAATFFPNVGEVVEKTVLWPLTLLNATSAFLKTRDPIKGLSRGVEELLPTGLFDTWLMQRRLFQTYRRYGVGNRFGNLPRDLFIIATDLDDGARAIFSKRNDVPLEKAVAASCALPLIYRPVRINGHDYVDGGVRGTASIDLALDEGADLIIVINSLVPYTNHVDVPSQPLGSAEPRGHLSNRGPVAISNQVTRAAIHSGLLYHIKQVKRNYPHVNIMLIEPPSEDPTLPFRNIMSYQRLNEVAHQGFRVGMSFWRRNEEIAREVLEQRGIHLATRLQEPVA